VGAGNRRRGRQQSTGEPGSQGLALVRVMIAASMSRYLVDRIRGLFPTSKCSKRTSVTGLEAMTDALKRLAASRGVGGRGSAADPTSVPLHRC